MMKTLAPLVSALMLCLAAPAMADDQTIDGGNGTVIVVTPSPVVVSGASQQSQPVAAPGIAPPMAPPMVAPAPQNEPWSNVSHINGQLVPVGEHGNSTYSWKKTNISSNPIGWMFGFYGLSVSQAVNNNIAIRGDANMFDFKDTGGYEIGASVPIYFKRVYQGPFLEPGIIVREFHSKYSGTCDFDCGSNHSLVGPEVLFGWHWTFDSGMNVALAVGAAKNMNKSGMSYGSDVEPAGYFRIGYAF